MRLILLLIAVSLCVILSGCVTQEDFESYRLSQDENWEDVDGRINYLKTEQDKLKKTVKKHDDLRTGGPGFGSGGASFTSLGTDPPNTPVGSGRRITPPTPTTNNDISPGLKQWIEERFGKVPEKQDEILGKLGEVLVGVTSNGEKIKDLGDRVTDIEKHLRLSPEPEK